MTKSIKDIVRAAEAADRSMNEIVREIVARRKINSMDEIVRAEIEAEAAAIEISTEPFQYGERRKLITGREIVLTPEYFRNEAYHIWNNFACYLPNSDGFVDSPHLMDRIVPQEKFQQDVLTAITESGVNEVELQRYMDGIHPRGSDCPHADMRFHGNLESTERLVLPVYIKLREMGYSAVDLGK